MKGWEGSRKSEKAENYIWFYLMHQKLSFQLINYKKLKLRITLLLLRDVTKDHCYRQKHEAAKT